MAGPHDTSATSRNIPHRAASSYRPRGTILPALPALAAAPCAPNARPAASTTKEYDSHVALLLPFLGGAQPVPNEANRDLCAAIVAGAPDAIIAAGPDGAITLWNEGATTMFGYSAAETIGHSLDLIIPERQRQRHWDGYHRVMQTGQTRYGTELLAVPAMRKDGSRISVEFTIVLLKDAAGRPAGVAAVVRDVTARRAEQQALRDRLAQLEARLAASEPPASTA
ncbi:MAG: PAS domain S-box protein [Chloroflexi bacterium]|nr:PAS domain S-box protein [Chloroflexota bacterium]